MLENNKEHLQSLSSIKDFIRWGASRFVEAGLFFGHGAGAALDEAAMLVLHTLHLPYNLDMAYFDSALSPVEKDDVLQVFNRRIKERIPAAYITRHTLFAGLEFYVDERTLVPRSPIAELIEEQFMPWVDPDQVLHILDLCTGGGCIACACAYAFPDASVDAVDISEQALQVAEINVQQHQLQNQVKLIQSDLFTEVRAQKYDLIVSNPPYVAAAELQQLPAEYYAEPSLGLAGGGDGLDLVLLILRDALEMLTEQGILVVEVGSSAETLQMMFPDVAFYWLDFERGGDGVFLLTAAQLAEINFPALMNLPRS